MRKTKATKVKTKAPLIPETPKAEVIPKDLKDQWSAVEAVATAFTVLDKGYFPHSFAAAVKQSLGFLAKIHEQTIDACLKHPQAHMIPELKEQLTKTKEGSVNDGEKTEQAQIQAN